VVLASPYRALRGRSFDTLIQWRENTRTILPVVLPEFVPGALVATSASQSELADAEGSAIILSGNYCNERALPLGK